MLNTRQYNFPSRVIIFCWKKKKIEMISNIVKKRGKSHETKVLAALCTKSRDTPFHGKNTKQNRDLETTTIIRN